MPRRYPAAITRGLYRLTTITGLDISAHINGAHETSACDVMKGSTRTHQAGGENGRELLSYDII